jgi:hypothetical protein
MVSVTKKVDGLENEFFSHFEANRNVSAIP